MYIVGLFFNNELRTGGHTRYLELMEGLAARGNRVAVFMNSHLSYVPSHFERHDLAIPYTRGKHLSLGGRFLSFVKKQYASCKPVLDGAEAILIFGETHWKSALYMAGKEQVPLYFAYRSDPVQENLVYLRYEKLSLRERVHIYLQLIIDYVRGIQIAHGATRIFFQSEQDRSAFLSRHTRSARPEKTSVVRGDLRQKRFKPEYRDTNKSTRLHKILFVGTLGRRKGLEYLLKALALCKDKTDYTLDILAGDVENSPLPALCTSLGIADRVHFHGKQSGVLQWMASSDLLVVPSLFDSYPNTILEALHTGLPVLGSRSGGIPDMLVHDELLFDKANEQQLAEKLVSLNDQEQYQQTRKLCSQRRDYFDFDWASAWQKEFVQP